jgi:hypothetical protein
MSYIFWDIMLHGLFTVNWHFRGACLSKFNGLHGVVSQKTELFTTTAENFKAYREGTCPSLIYEVDSKRKSFMSCVVLA